MSVCGIADESLPSPAGILGALLLLALTAGCARADDWSWGSESPREAKVLYAGPPPAPGRATLSVSVSPEEEEEPQVFAVENPIVLRAISSDPLPLEIEGSLTGWEDLGRVEGVRDDVPRASYVVSGDGVEGVEVVDGLVVFEDDGGDREGRFLGIGEKLCSYGLGINVSTK